MSQVEDYPMKIGLGKIADVLFFFCRVRHQQMNSVILPPLPLGAEQKVNTEQYYGEPGTEHYRLLAWLSFQFQDAELFDIGSHQGLSALALSANPRNRVISFDIDLSGIAVRPDNCDFRSDDLFNPSLRNQPEWKERILKSPFILIDIDPHEGIKEYEFYEWLVANDYKGLVMYDDTWYFKSMQDNLWKRIPDRHKWDLTPLGHFSGTGLVHFGNQMPPSIAALYHPFD